MKYKNKYRIPSARLQSWDYGWNGTYFITICTRNRRYYFGNIVGGKMRFTELGKQAQMCAMKIPLHFPFVVMDEFVIMPNHVHLLFTINKTDAGMDVGTANVETQNFASLPPPSSPYQQKPTNRFGPQSRNVASIIRGFKIGVTKFARNNGIIFDWQSRFHDHIVRNSQEYNRIKEYIQNNVNQWDNDSLNA